MSDILIFILLYVYVLRIYGKGYFQIVVGMMEFKFKMEERCKLTIYEGMVIQIYMLRYQIQKKLFNSIAIHIKTNYGHKKPSFSPQLISYNMPVIGNGHFTCLNKIDSCAQYKRIDLMQNEQVAADILQKDLVFKEYSSLQLSTRDKFIKKIRELKYDSPDILWTASEKIHGSNFSIHYNGEFARYGRRTDFLTKDIPVPCANPGEYFNESFLDAKTLVKKFHDDLAEVYGNIKHYDPKLLKFSIYGEYFGGNWPVGHPQGIKNGPKQVQKGVWYTPHHQFFAFDIFVTNTETAYWVDVMDIPKLLKGVIEAVPVYVKGTFDEAFNVNIEIDSTIPGLLGLDKLDNNIIEGMVIRPNCNLKTPLNERVIIKKKNKEFVEKASEPNPAKKQKKGKVIDPEIAPLLDELLRYLNVNRIDSVVSKFPDLKDRNKLKELITNDIITDAEKDEVKLTLNEDKYKELLKELGNAVIKEVNGYFVKH